MSYSLGRCKCEFQLTLLLKLWLHVQHKFFIHTGVTMLLFYAAAIVNQNTAYVARKIKFIRELLKQFLEPTVWSLINND